MFRQKKFLELDILLETKVSDENKCDAKFLSEQNPSIYFCAK